CLFESKAALEARHGLVDLLVCKKYLDARRKPSNGRAFGIQRLKRCETCGRGFGLLLKACCFAHFALGRIQLALLLLHGSKHCVATAIKRPEKEIEIDVKKKDEAHQTKGNFLDLVFPYVELAHCFGPRAGRGDGDAAAVFAAAPALKPTVK